MTTQEFKTIIDFKVAKLDYDKLMDFHNTDTCTMEYFIPVHTQVVLSRKLTAACKTILARDEKGNIAYFYIIKDENVVEYLRDIWFLSKNLFVKNIVKTVGVSKKLTRKQADVITEEAIKLNIELTF